VLNWQTQSSARVSFLVALTWGFIWAWALYSAGWGYLKNIRDTYQELYALSLTHRNDVYFNDVCNQITSGITKATVTTSEKIEVCSRIVTQRFKWSDNAFLEGTMVSFPGGFGKLSIADLGIVGQFGLLLILSWCFFAVRRENYAIRAIVDRKRNSGRGS
jgi:hypothetical protein